MSKNTKSLSPLVHAVVDLDNSFSELLRLGEMIEELDMKSNFDFEHAQRLINRFAERGQILTDQVAIMSTALSEARVQAEATAQFVSVRAEQLQTRKSEQEKKMEEFRLLGEKVKNLTLSLNDLKPVEGVVPTEEDRAKISMRLTAFELELHPLIEEAMKLKKEAQSSKMKALEQGAESLGQSLSNISQKLSVFQQTSHLQ